MPDETRQDDSGDLEPHEAGIAVTAVDWDADGHTDVIELAYDGDGDGLADMSVIGFDMDTQAVGPEIVAVALHADSDGVLDTSLWLEATPLEGGSDLSDVDEFDL